MSSRMLPNMHFAGQCEAAMALYEAALGAEALSLHRGEDGRVYHAEMMICGQRVLMTDEASDDLSADHISVSLAVLFDTPAAVADAFAAMEPGATVIHPLAETAYSGAFVSLVDRFGIRWELMHER